MRRIFKTTTAIIACLALVAPQLATAQDQSEGGLPKKLLPRHGQQEQPAAAQPAPESIKPGQAQKKPTPAKAEAEPAKPQPKAAPAKQAGAEAPAPQAKKAAKPQPEAAAKPAAKAKAPAEPAPVKAQAEKQPAKKPPVTQAKDPVKKPAVVQAETPTAKPAPKEGAPMPTRAQKPPKPAAPEAAAPTKPAVKQPAAEGTPIGAEALREKRAAEAGQQPAKPVKPGKAAPEQASANDGKAAGQDAPKPTGAPIGAEALREKLAAEVGQQPAKPVKPGKAAPEQAAANDGKAAGQGVPKPTGAPIGADALREKLAVEAGQQPAKPAKPGQPAPGQTAPGQIAANGDKPVEVPAPEAKVKPNDVAIRAAEQATSSKAAALVLGAKPGAGKVDDVKITTQNARSSAEDFATSVTQGLQTEKSGKSEKQARKDDGNDRGRDIAALLLAGAAGFAVGKMLSNDRQVALNTGDRVVVTLPDGSQQVIKDDNALLYRPGSNVQTETFDDGSTRTTVLRADGSRVVTIRDADMNVLRRTLVRADGSEVQLIDDTIAQPVRVSTLPAPPPVEVIRRPLDEAALRAALQREAQVDRRFTLAQIRDIPEVRALVAPVNVPEVTFDTGSAAITPDQAQQLATLGKVIRDSIISNPNEVYMIEGYTDAVGSSAANLALSDRRAESVALALTEYFQVPPENMVVQGYGKQFLLIPTDGAERQNRRVAVRRITQLLEQK
jgi:outer membrane protein OmpA-like peptidoglycan-associated protein